VDNWIYYRILKKTIVIAWIWDTAIPANSAVAIDFFSCKH